MDIEQSLLEELKLAFHTKMNAASFFLDQVKTIYEPEKDIPVELPNELYYFVDATIFELHAASQMLLQIVNIKGKVNFPSFKVNWNEGFRTQLKKNNQKLFKWWTEFNISTEFHILDGMRQHISHR